MNIPDKRNQYGFTLIELLVVSTIIIVVSAIGITSYANVSQGARDAKRKSDLEDVRTTLLLFRSENGYYPIAATEGGPRISFLNSRKIISKLASVFDFSDAFRVQKVQAVLLDDGYVIPPEDAGTGPVIIDDSATPIPTIVAETSSPTISPAIETRPAAARSYDSMIDELVTNGYLETDDVVYDPIDDNQYYYGYDSPDGLGFELTATLEKDNSIITLTN